MMGDEAVRVAQAVAQGIVTDPAELERMRKATLIPMLRARGVSGPQVDRMDSVALRKLLHALPDPVQESAA